MSSVDIPNYLPLVYSLYENKANTYPHKTAHTHECVPNLPWLRCVEDSSNVTCANQILILFYRESTKTDTLHHLLIKMYSLSPWLKGIFGGCGQVPSEGQIFTSCLDFSTLPLSSFKSISDITVERVSALCRSFEWRPSFKQWASASENNVLHSEQSSLESHRAVIPGVLTDVCVNKCGCVIGAEPPSSLTWAPPGPNLHLKTIPLELRNHLQRNTFKNTFTIKKYNIWWEQLGKMKPLVWR